jgi:hypothetical protein
VEESKPAAHVLEKQVGADGRHVVAILWLVWLVAHGYVTLWLTMSNKQINKGRIIKHLSSILNKLITRASRA